MEEQTYPVYLTYDMNSRLVYSITDTVPELPDTTYNYAVADSSLFKPGDEFTSAITLHEIDEQQQVKSYGALRNNPHAARLLSENAQLKTDKAALQTKTLLLEDYILEVDFRLALTELGML